MVDGAGELHLAVCRRFGEAVAAADGKWDRRTPCEAWDARAVLEHVIGFHDVLLLRPLGLKPDRSEDPRARWRVTYESLVAAFGSGHVTGLEAYQLVPMLTRDVLVHTWDLARAIGADDRLDPEWCQMFCDNLPADHTALVASGMFNAPVAVRDADAQAKLLARLGRDPLWTAAS